MKSRTVATFLISVGTIAAQPQDRRTDYSLINSKVVTVKGTLRPSYRVTSGPIAGTLIPDACTIHLSLKPGERAVEARPKSAVRRTPAGCELEMEVGQPPEDQIAPMSPPPSSPAVPTGPNLVLNPVTSAGYLQAHVRDPVFIWTTSEEVDLSWTWTQHNCATTNSLSRHVPAFFSGWYIYFATLRTEQSCQMDGRHWLTTTGGYSVVIWEDDSFPVCTDSVYAFYDPMEIYGDGDGNLFGNYSITIEGPACTSLLSIPDALLVRTLN